MNLADLLKRYRTALRDSVEAASMEARASHRGLADGYAERIARLQVNASVAGSDQPADPAASANEGTPLSQRSDHRASTERDST